ncbi:MAG: hypothetical protein U0132_14455 [Gemmatimonadaceae bacterium]
MSNKIRILMRVVLTSGAVALAACSNPTDATQAARFNTTQVEAGVATVNRVAETPVLTSVLAMSQFVGAAARPRTSDELVGAGGSLQDAVARLATTVLTSGTAMLPLMHHDVLGKTFVYDEATARYQVDPSRTGAPANGVRFILYETDANKRPIVARPIGYADLTDEQRASPSAIGLKFVVVTDGVTRLTYLLNVTGSLSDPVFDVSGYLSDGTDRVDFTITANPRFFGNSAPATVDATLRVPGTSFSVTAHAVGIPGAPRGDGTIALTITSATDRIQVASTVAAGVLDATFTVNGAVFATATGNPEAPVIRGKDGQELTADELRALGAVVDLAGHIFTMIADLLQPVGALLVIALGITG